MNRSRPRTALVTGASHGLGLALARQLGECKWRLILNARGSEALEAARCTLSALTSVTAVAGDIATAQTRRALVQAVGEHREIDLLINNASLLGPSPLPNLLDYPLPALEEIYAVNVFAPLALIQELRKWLRPGARVLNVTSDAGVEAYPSWGGYGSSKAALEQLSAVLAVEEPTLRIYWVDPGDMRTKMHQDAFPGEDISDRPLPETVVPGFMQLIEGDLPSGRYSARSLLLTVPK